MYYVRTTGGSMMAITPKSTAVIAVKKKPAVVKTIMQAKKDSLKKS
jgi:hypothetical protein